MFAVWEQVKKTQIKGNFELKISFSFSLSVDIERGFLFILSLVWRRNSSKCTFTKCELVELHGSRSYRRELFVRAVFGCSGIPICSPSLFNYFQLFGSRITTLMVIQVVRKRIIRLGWFVHNLVALVFCTYPKQNDKTYFFNLHLCILCS